MMGHLYPPQCGCWQAGIAALAREVDFDVRSFAPRFSSQRQIQNHTRFRKLLVFRRFDGACSITQA